LEWELDGALLDNSDRLQAHLRRGYAACQKAVQEELARQSAAPSAGQDPPSGACSPPGSGNGQDRAASDAQPASGRQLAYLRTLAGQIAGLDMRRLDALAKRQFQCAWNDLSGRHASVLIDQLVSVRDGTMDLNTLVGETAL
jgi:hypothetical protein